MVVSGFIYCIYLVLSDIIALVGLNSDNRPPIGTSTYYKTCPIGDYNVNILRLH